jgi:hypothetical protein
MTSPRFRAFVLAAVWTGAAFADGPRVVSVTAVDRLPESPGALAPNHEMEMVVENLDQLCPAGRTSQPGEPLQVYLDGVVLPGAIAIDQRPDPRGTHLRFFLPIGADTQSVWAWVARTTDVLDEPTVRVAVSVGYADCLVPGQGQAQALDANFLVLRRNLRNLWLALAIGFGAVLIWLGRRTSLLRDPSPNRPFSLSKTQAAWWLYLILTSFALVLMVTGFPPTLSSDVLVLLGLSSVTGVLGGVMENQQAAARVTQGGGIVQEFLGFWKDLLFDPSTGGISLGRLQFVAWTVVIGVYFAYRSLTTLSLPDIGNQLLLLQGISAGTYVAVKNGEG